MSRVPRLIFGLQRGGKEGGEGLEPEVFLVAWTAGATLDGADAARCFLSPLDPFWI
jgi:hypothetical protein